VNDLARKTLVGLAQFIGTLGILLFVPAWTLDFWQAWIYLFVFAVSVALITVYLWKKDPKLLERRVNVGPGAEKEKSQKRIQSFAAAAFIGTFLFPALDRRFSWSKVPFSVVMVGDVLVALGFFIVFLVFKENTYSAGTIEVVADQKVVSTGPYALVRHPMYSGALVMLFATPLGLGSWWGLIMFIPVTLLIVWRLLDEEKFLLRNLQGYAEYSDKVRSRLLPFVW
jgi:protein-S-isoprenylcysteine O-methyltransferase Ste14